MQVILLERIAKLGDMGEEVAVKPGYARNYLLPQGKALRASSESRRYFESQRTNLEEQNRKRRDEALGIASGMDGLAIALIRQAGDTGQLYGSVSARDVADALAAEGYKVGRNQVHLDRPIKELGLHEVRIILHPEVIETVTLNVARSHDEAAAQARGLTITDIEAAADAEAAAEAAAELAEDTEESDEGEAGRRPE